jgi:hypothetical protein
MRTSICILRVHICAYIICIHTDVYPRMYTSHTHVRVCEHIRTYIQYYTVLYVYMYTHVYPRMHTSHMCVCVRARVCMRARGHASYKTSVFILSSYKTSVFIIRISVCVCKCTVTTGLYVYIHVCIGHVLLPWGSRAVPVYI